MCLAVPGKIITVTGESLARTGRVRFGHLEKTINLSLVSDADVGDYILAHAGIAISKMHADDADRLFDIYDESHEGKS